MELGDIVYIKEENGPITSDNWLGENNRITSFGPFEITKVGNGYVLELNGIRCCLVFSRFRMAEDVEIRSRQGLEYRNKPYENSPEIENPIPNKEYWNLYDGTVWIYRPIPCPMPFWGNVKYLREIIK